MNKQKKAYIKPGIVFEDFRTGELRGTPEMIDKIKAKQEKEISCPMEEVSFSCSARSGN